MSVSSSPLLLAKTSIGPPKLSWEGNCVPAKLSSLHPPPFFGPMMIITSFSIIHTPQLATSKGINEYPKVANPTISYAFGQFKNQNSVKMADNAREHQQPQQQSQNSQTTTMNSAAAAELAMQQVQLGINAFSMLMLQQIALQQQQQQQGGGGGGTLGQFAPFPSMANPLNINGLNVGGSSSSSSAAASILARSPVKTIENVQPQIGNISEGGRHCQQQLSAIKTDDDEKRQRDLAIIGKRWHYVEDVASFTEFEQLRCRHQVSRNRTFAHGIRYSCTQKTQMRSNCPYLLLCLFSDGAGEHSAPGVGTISVYSRNDHSHPVKVIKARQPRRFAKLAKRRKERRGSGGEETDRNEREKSVENGRKSAEMNGNGQAADPAVLIQMLGELSKQLEEQRQREAAGSNNRWRNYI